MTQPIHPMPSADVLRELIDYDPISGRMVWLPREVGKYGTTKGTKAFNTVRAGTDAACSTGRYLGVQTPFGRFQAHRIAWKIMTGEEPALIDHIDGNGRNNAFRNLRSVTQSENLRNRALGSNNTSGHTGVSWCARRQRWRAGIKINQRRIELGIFVNKDDAIRARLAAEKRHDFMPVTRSIAHG